MALRLGAGGRSLKFFFCYQKHAPLKRHGVRYRNEGLQTFTGHGLLSSVSFTDQSLTVLSKELSAFSDKYLVAGQLTPRLECLFPCLMWTRDGRCPVMMGCQKSVSLLHVNQ